MIKVELVELITDSLAGGDAPDDVRGKYHPEVVGAWIELAYQHFMSQLEKSDDPLAGSSLVLEFEDISVVEGTSYWTATLPATPLSGGGSVYSVSEVAGGLPYTYYPSGGPAVYQWFLSSGKGNPYTIQGNDIRWKQCPNKSKKVVVQMLPSFRSLDEKAEFQVPEGGLKAITEYCITVMRDKNAKKEDVINNQEEDV